MYIYNDSVRNDLLTEDAWWAITKSYGSWRSQWGPYNLRWWAGHCERGPEKRHDQLWWAYV